MSDSIDRVFVKAISTIRALSTRTGAGSLPRPPVEARIMLYGLYKQATEGNVEGVMDRPLGSRPEDENAKRKWDAWKSEEGLSKTEAKRRYISYLIETMKTYATGSNDARELLSELEYLWDQIKDIDPTPTPPMTPRVASHYNTSQYNGSMYGSTAYISGGGGYDDLQSELRDVAIMKREVAMALRKVSLELEKVKKGKESKEWEGFKRMVRFLCNIIGGVLKRLLVDLMVVLMILKFIKFKQGLDLNLNSDGEVVHGLVNKSLLWIFKLLDKCNLIGWKKIHIDVL